MFSSTKFNFIIPIISVILGLVAGAIIMLIFGYNPILGYQALWNGVFDSPFFMSETVNRITPYILTGLAIAFAFRTGLFNIGAEGQVLVGWVAAVWVGTAVDAPAFIHLPLALLAAAAAGAFWAFVPGILKAKLGVHEVIVSIMMNYIALHITNYLIRSVLTDNQETTEPVKQTASLTNDFLIGLTGSRLHLGFIVALLMVLVMWVILERTKLGFELKAVGYNQHASNYAGMKVERNIVISMLISGLFAGLAGAMQGLGTFGNAFTNTAFSNLGFDGIAVALLGGNNPFGVVLSASLFGFLKVGSLNMSTAGVPNEIIEIVIALIILFVASGFIIRWALLQLKKGEKK
ncbi:ABC transporter permease [Terribacillus saccharophilus]|uniref:Branched-chain amino acid ABC transporter permease n=1 Tax=Terribacillus saccharophilus TaxID=361277 RepID=A0A268A9Q2_9BACI|nr:ABC transporter permease [Terribacillus saccharophilus]PAD20799.1 branched-chain amino acid ABC transporter permease [Terribacillus saccharophilus]PAF22240.1 branched-chain amino acid ABC transporter permease [Terribacillus saccharophilus]PAF38433.1 branched-chain amino acid ABC transporter permease [Terribacillus saccharophilus]PAF40119.1 branched-chain amino acid ABC transporter permease [Terribacillus saccharophilus]